MSEIQTFMKAEHKDGNVRRIAVESAVAAQDWDTAECEWSRFTQALRHHFEIEEQILFPAIASRTGMSGGPTDVMRALENPMADQAIDNTADQVAALLLTADFVWLLASIHIGHRCHARTAAAWSLSTVATNPKPRAEVS